MEVNTPDAEILAKIRSIVKEQAPNATVLLYGSRTRGDARPDSDWDILILLDADKISSAEYDRIAYPLFDLGMEYDTYISPKIYTKSSWEKRNFTIFYKNIESEGIVL
jgi:predicted nucleotidyltransferase